MFLTTVGRSQVISTGGPGGAAGGKAVIAFGDTAFIAANNYCMRTLDGGNTWTKMTNGLGTFPHKVAPTCFARLGNTIYMGTETANLIYRTSDFGETWAPYAEGVTWGGIATHMAVSNGRLFAAGNGLFNLSWTTGDAAGWHSTNIGGFAGTISVLGKDTLWATLSSKTFYTIDNGDTWTQIGKEPVAIGGTGATGYAAAGNRVIAITDAGGSNTTYYSDNYGESWTLATKGFAAGKAILKVSSDEIYALGHHSVITTPQLMQVSAVYKTTDQGVTWTPQAKIVGGSLAMTRWRSTDDLLLTGAYTVGRTDTAVAMIPFPFVTVKALTASETSLYALAPSGLFVRPLSGGNWTKLSDLKSDLWFQTNSLFAFANKLYLTTDSGIYVSSDGGQNFTLHGLQGKSILAYYNDGAVELASNSLPASFYPKSDTIYHNNGSGWAPTATEFKDFIYFLAQDFVKHNGKIFASGSNGHAVTSDNGRSWTWTKNDAFGYIIASRIYSFDGRLEREKYDFQGAGGTTDLQYSTDDGTTWHYDTVGIPRHVLGPSINGVFYSSGKMYAYGNKPGEEGLFVKGTAGAAWKKIAGTGKLPASPLQLISSDNDLFVSIYTESIWTTQTITGDVRKPKTNRSETIAVYPNPAHDRVSVVLPAGAENVVVEMLDAAGRRVLHTTINAGADLPFANIPGGIYLLRIGETLTKLLVQ